MSLTTPLRTAIKQNTTQFGFWLTLPSAALARGIFRTNAASSSARYSWAVIDGEHGLIGDKDYYELNNTIASEGASPIIRVPYAAEWTIKRALDSGAHGVMTPMCHSKDDATQIVQFSKYPPMGTRGYGPAFASHAFPNLAPGPGYDQGANKELMVIVQIESRSGVENAEAIARVDGIDVLFVGPFDLSKQMQIERKSEEHEKAIQRVLQAAKSAGKLAAIFCTNGEDARKRAEEGFDMISVASIEGALAEKMQAELDVASGSRKGSK